MAERILSKDEIIYREGDRGDTFFQVAEGTALVMIGYGQPNATVLTALTPGQFFGEMSAMGGYQRSATVVAGEDGTRLFEFAERDLDRWFAERPELILDLLKYRGARIRTLSKDYEDACAILEDLNAQKGRPRSESLLNKIRRIASYYRPSASKPSVEEKARQADHKDGYVKRVASFMPGTVIYRAGEPGTCMYDIHWGRVGIYSDYGTPDQRKLTELSVNEFFGEMGMLCGDPRSATAVALDEDTTIESIYPEDMQELFQKNPNKVWMVFEHVARRLRSLTADYAEVCAKICEITDKK